jgi:hypothetical protein
MLTSTSALSIPAQHYDAISVGSLGIVPDAPAVSCFGELLIGVRIVVTIADIVDVFADRPLVGKRPD